MSELEEIELSIEALWYYYGIVIKCNPVPEVKKNAVLSLLCKLEIQKIELTTMPSPQALKT